MAAGDALGAPRGHSCIEHVIGRSGQAGRSEVVFEAAAETLPGQPISPATLERIRAAGVTVPQLVEALFFMLVIGASHRFSVAFGVEESCPVPATLQASRHSPEGPTW